MVDREVVTTADRPSQISWGAVIAGLVLVVAVSWLMFLLGSAIGLGVADASDSEAVGRGLGIGAIIWMILTSLIAYFLGGILAGRLAGKPDKTVGMLHGITLWGVGTALMMILSYMGVKNLIQTGQDVLRGTASVTAALGAAAAGGAASTARGTGADLANSPLVASIQAQLKRKASEAIASATPAGGAPVSPQEAQQAMNQIDNNTLQAMAIQLVQGNTQGAKDILAANTTLTEDQINSVVQGVSNEVQSRVDQAKAELNQAAEKAAKYTQALLWTVFISSVLALLAAIAGGWSGADRVRRIYVGAGTGRVPG
jgi:CHASE3 domain sensor protein